MKLGPLKVPSAGVSAEKSGGEDPSQRHNADDEPHAELHSLGNDLVDLSSCCLRGAHATGAQ